MGAQRQNTYVDTKGGVDVRGEKTHKYDKRIDQRV